MLKFQNLYIYTSPTPDNKNHCENFHKFQIRSENEHRNQFHRCDEEALLVIY